MLIQFSRKSNQCCCTFRAFGPVLTQFSRKMDQCCCSFRTCENCSNTGGPVWLQFSHNPGLRENCETLVDQSCRSFRANFARKLRQYWWTSLVAVFAQTRFCAKTATTLVDQSCCSFRTTGVCVKVAKHWWTGLVAVFTQNGFA